MASATLPVFWLPLLDGWHEATPKRPEKGKAMTSDAPQSPKNGSATDSTSSSPGTAGSWARDAWVVGEPSSAYPNPENSQQDVESIPVVEIRYPKGIEDDARAHKFREQRRDRWKVFLEALIVVGVLGYGAIAYRQWHTTPAASDNSTKALQKTERAYVTALQTTERTYVTTLQTTERAFMTALQTTERAYVTFGSKSGELGEFIDNPMPGEKRIIVLHFYNSGHSTARHLAIQAVTDNPGPISSRHRFKGPQGDIVSTGASIERDLAAGAEHLEYVDSPWSQRELANMAEGERFSVFGQFEYCDIFGTYHCQGFSTNYLSNIKQFVPSPTLPCALEPIGPKERPGKGYKEIEPCEQPNEPESIEAGTPVLAPTQSTTP
jgi:hypothetical protein